MLTCVFHPIDAMRVVEEDEAARLQATGVWFDSPTQAKAYRAKVEDKIKQESLVNKKLAPQPKAKLTRKSNER